MKNRKKRILIVSEASFTKSGFGVYANEVISRLVATGKYEIAEFASYANCNDPRDRNVNWRFYANAVKDDDARIGQYRSKVTNQWGEWRFDRVCLDFRQDVTLAYRDPWNDEWIKDSVFRKFFHWVWMPTVDSAPIADQWLDSYAKADGVLAYSDWNLGVMRDEGNNKIKLYRSAPPGTNLNLFKPPEDKAAHKSAMGLDPKMKIVGTVMRNQIRKLYPDILDSFRLYLEKLNERGQHELAQNTYLYFHTSYPDAGWNFPRLLKESGVSHKVIFSYLCRACGKWFASPFQDALGTCPHCKNLGGAILPNVGNGVSSEVLANVTKCFDLYVQYSITEGFGICEVEAGCCGVPTMGMPYSATKDILEKTNGTPIKIAKAFLDVGTQAYRMMPDNNDLAEKMIEFFNKPEEEQKEMGRKTRLACEEHYDYDKTAKIWENYIDSVELKGTQGQWNFPPEIYPIPDSIPPNLNNEQFVTWLCNEVVHEPTLRHTYPMLKIISDLNIGIAIDGNNMSPVNRDQLFASFKNLAQNRNIGEQARCGLLTLPNEDYINYANMKSASINMKEE